MFSFGRENTGLVAKWWRNIDKHILFLFAFLLLLGLFFSFSSTTSIMSEKMNKQTYFFFIKHLIFVFISLFLLITISIQEKNKLIKFLIYLFLVSIVLLFLTLVVGVEIKGSKRWMSFDPLPRFQPVELVKPLFIIFVAKIIVLNEKDNIYKDLKFKKSLKSTILLSPAAASFDQFNNFENRGNYFKNLIMKKFKPNLNV